MVKKGFPLIKRDTVATRAGNFYVYHLNRWYKMELYLPSSPSTYGFESLEDCANSFMDDIESGKRIFKYAIMASGGYDSKDYSNDVLRWFK